MQSTDRTPRGKTYLTARQVCSRYGGISDMTLWRWLNDPEMGFPCPRYINRRRYWDEAELDEFDRAQASEPEAA